jgi:hypothetical protein
MLLQSPLTIYQCHPSSRSITNPAFYYRTPLLDRLLGQVRGVLPGYGKRSGLTSFCLHVCRASALLDGSWFDVLSLKFFLLKMRVDHVGNLGLLI